MTISALQSEEAVLGRIHKQQLIESIDQMSPVYLEGMKRILTVSADTELISAPAYYHAGIHAPSLNTFGSAMSIIQDELSHAHIAYRLLRDLGVNTEELIFEREPRLEQVAAISKGLAEGPRVRDVRVSGAAGQGFGPA